MRKAIVFEAYRSGYGIDQIADEAMTVGDLVEILGELPPDTLFVLSHDRGYTYGSIDVHNSHFEAEKESGDFEEMEDIYSEV